MVRNKDGLGEHATAEDFAEVVSEPDIVISDGTGSIRLAIKDVQLDAGWLTQTTRDGRRPAPGTFIAPTET